MKTIFIAMALLGIAVISNAASASKHTKHNQALSKLVGSKTVKLPKSVAHKKAAVASHSKTKSSTTSTAAHNRATALDSTNNSGSSDNSGQGSDDDQLENQQNNGGGSGISEIENDLTGEDNSR